MLLILIIARSNQIRVYLYFKVSICSRYFNTVIYKTRLVGREILSLFTRDLPVFELNTCFLCNHRALYINILLLRTRVILLVNFMVFK